MPGCQGAMTNPLEGQRHTIRRMCGSLRGVLTTLKPAEAFAMLQDVAKIERAVGTSLEQFQGLREDLRRLLRQLKDRGVIDAERSPNFFGDGELQLPKAP